MAIAKVFRQALQVNYTPDVNHGECFIVEVAIEVRSTKWAIVVSVDGDVIETRSGEMLSTLAAAALSWPNAPKRKVVKLESQYFHVNAELGLKEVTCAIRPTGYSTVPASQPASARPRRRKRKRSLN